MKRVMITGASGFIGKHCLPILASIGYEVHAVDVRIPEILSPDVNWHYLDLLNPVQTRKLIEDICPTYLLHFAWYAVPDKYWASLENISWVESSLNLFRVFHDFGGERVVVAGTCAEYDWRFGYCSESLTPLTPGSFYGQCKNELRRLLKIYSMQTGMSSAWGRLFFLFGPYEHPKRLVPSVVRSLLHNEKTVCSDGRQIRDYLYVEDVAQAFVALLESRVTGAVNIASGQPVSIKDMIYKIADMLNKKELVQLGGLKTADAEPPVLFANITRLSQEVGWIPKFTLDQGIRKTISWLNDRIEE